MHIIFADTSIFHIHIYILFNIFL